MTTEPTRQELIDERARTLDQIDDIINTIASRAENDRTWTDQERNDHDLLVWRSAELDAEIGRATLAEGDEQRIAAHEIRRSQSYVPMVNLNRPSPMEGRTLDDALWATADAVRADQGNAFNPVDQVVIRAEVSDEGRLAPRVSSYRPQHHDAVRSFQQTVAEMCVSGMLMDKDADTSSKGFEVARSHRLFKDKWNHVLRAMDTDTSAEGVEWIPTGIGATLHEKVRASGKVAPLFQRINIPTNPWKWPIEGADATFYRVAEPTSDTATKVTASTPGTVAATFDAEIFGGRVLISRSLEADSAVAIAPYILNKLAQAFVDGEEKAILDGDTDGTHMDTDTQAVGATDARSAWDGLRKKALAQTVATATSCTALNLGVVRKAMGKWGVNPADLAFIIGVSNLHALLADTNLLTVDKMGPNAVILNGQIGSVFGVPVIVSEHVREDLNASGVNDGITATKTYMLAVNRNEYAIGQRMALDIQTDDSIYRESFQRVAVAFQREDFQHIGSAATNEDCAIAYNVTP